MSDAAESLTPDIAVPFIAELARNGQPANALAMVDDLLNRGERSVSLLLLKARISAQSGDVAAAREAGLEAAALDPGNSETARVLAAVDRLSTRGPRSFWMPVAIGLALTVVALLAALMTRTPPPPPSASVDFAPIEKELGQLRQELARQTARVAAMAVSEPGPSADVVASIASLESAARGVSKYADVHFATQVEGTAVIARASGTVPTIWLKARIAAVGRDYPNLVLDLGDLLVTNRITIEQNDVLSEIAANIYGHSGWSRRIVAANPGTITDPNVIRPGEILVPD